MKKTTKLTMIVCLALLSCVLMFTACSSKSASDTTELNESRKLVTIELDGNNYIDYFDISVEYYNYTSEKTGGTVVLGAYIPPTYKATVSQRIKITPKSNVVSLENVSFNHYANGSTSWSYDSSNKGDYNENAKKNDWLIILSSNGTYDNSKTMYYYSILSEASCPIPESSLNISLIDDVTGTVTIYS